MIQGKRRFQVMAAVWLAVLLVLPGAVQADKGNEAQQELQSSELYAASAVVMEAQTGRILFEKNGSEQRAMASTTKLMTLLVALEYGDFDEPVMVSSRAASQPMVHMNLQPGETFRLMDLLYAMMLVSYNDAAMAVAEAIAGSSEDFCYLMNLKARELGACHTHFSTPNGLDAQDHYSTAVDMALIARAVLADETARTIMQTRSYTIQQDEVNSRTVALENKNPLLSSYTAAIGGKTGFTSEAGLCLVGMAEQEGTQLITVVLGSGWPPHSNYRIADTMKLFQYGFSAFRRQELDLEALDEHPSVEVSGSETHSVRTCLSGTMTYYMKQDDTVSLYYELPFVTEAPVETGQILGQAVVCINGRAIGYVDVTAQENAEEKSFRRILWNVCRSFWHSADADPAESAKSGSQPGWSG